MNRLISIIYGAWLVFCILDFQASGPDPGGQVLVSGEDVIVI